MDEDGHHEYCVSLWAADKKAANDAVKEALASFQKQKWHETLRARIRFMAYWATYWIRLRLAIFGVMHLGWDDKRTWMRLGL